MYIHVTDIFILVLRYALEIKYKNYLSPLCLLCGNGVFYLLYFMLLGVCDAMSRLFTGIVQISSLPQASSILSCL